MPVLFHGWVFQGGLHLNGFVAEEGSAAVPTPMDDPFERAMLDLNP
ncbi:hypothetical protein [Deinococcus cellulosilyticus]|nr:hypothetical protein [Deinococcus cellulosilyticus]